MGPTVSNCSLTGNTPSLLIDPQLGRRPVIPHAAAGRRTDPPVSVPRDASTNPAATAIPEPPLDPPGTRARFHGLYDGPAAEFCEVTPTANSAMFSFATTDPPARRRRVTTSASDAATLPSKNSEAQVVSTPATSMLSLTPIRRPDRGPGVSFRSSIHRTTPPKVPSSIRLRSGRAARPSRLRRPSTNRCSRPHRSPVEHRPR